MNIFVSFSGRSGGNCDAIAAYLADPSDRVVCFRDFGFRPCAGCDYQCVRGPCKHRGDGFYELLSGWADAERTVFVVPMYCGGPPALYAAFSERSQDFFIHDRARYEAWTERLYIVGVYGGAESWPHFLDHFARQYGHSDHILGLERGCYHQKMDDRLLDVPEVREKLDGFRKFALRGEENGV